VVAVSLFNAGFLHGWVNGWPIDKALAFGSRTGAWSTSASGGTSAFRITESIGAKMSAWEDEFESSEKYTNSANKKRR
jgi:hypothetical protein